MTGIQAEIQNGPTPQLGFGTRLRGCTMEKARAEVVAALAAEGFGVVSEIDMRAAIERKLGVKGPPYLILGACNPVLARQLLQTEPYAGLLLPCNVTLWEEAGDIVVTFASPRAMFGLLDDDRLRPLMLEAERAMRGALERLVE